MEEEEAADEHEKGKGSEGKYKVAPALVVGTTAAGNARCSDRARP